MKVEIIISERNDHHIRLRSQYGEYVGETEISELYDESFVSDSNDSYSTFIRNKKMHIKPSFVKDWMSLGSPAYVVIDDSGNILRKFAVIVGKELMFKYFADKESAVTFCQNNLDQSKDIVIREINV